MRTRASILHLDLDAFFASVEQRDKPSLRGKPVIVGGVGQRGVVSTASYEARVFGVHSAMPMWEARRRCPHAAFLSGRFRAYRQASEQVMGLLRALSPRVEPLSLDEAFVDLEAAESVVELGAAGVQRVAAELKAAVTETTGGLHSSVGLGSSKFIAKLATELGKPDGLHLVEPGTEVSVIAPLPVSVLPGVGPVTAEKLIRVGLRTVGDLQAAPLADLVREVGKAHGRGLHELAHARDDRPVVPEREAKSISVEDTFETDLTDRDQLGSIIDRDARLVARRVREAALFARTVQLKIKMADFTSITRARTLDGATDRAETIAAVARELLAALDIADGVRLLGVGVSGLTDIAQEHLFDLTAGSDSHDDHLALEVPTSGSDEQKHPERVSEERRPAAWTPGADVTHNAYGPGWVWGSGLGRVTVRFETAETGVGPVRTFALDDPDLALMP
ncbi:DNA polymerase IV [Propionibacteriaceae bacterium Y1685]|uniref:DNA polymerase IV n=1 Tax=Microlunatus sp. Y1700 TaxID=3418487 RepID=UPI003B763223